MKQNWSALDSLFGNRIQAILVLGELVKISVHPFPDANFVNVIILLRVTKYKTQEQY